MEKDQNKIGIQPHLEFMQGKDEGLGSGKYEGEDPGDDDKYFGSLETPIMISGEGMMTDDEVAIDGHGCENIC